jgi:hypothetical protein
MYDAEFEARVMKGLASAGCPPLTPPLPKEDGLCDWERRERYVETSGSDYKTYPCHFCHSTDGISKQYEFCIGASFSAGVSAEAVSAGLGVEISYCVAKGVSCNKNPDSGFICLRSEVPRRASSGYNNICQGRGCNAPPNCWTNHDVSVDYIKRTPHFWCDNRNDWLC